MLRSRPALGAVVLLAFPTRASAQQLEARRDVNLRKGPSISNQIITVVDSGTTVDSLMRRKGWDRVQIPDGTKGWIFANFLKPHSPGPPPPTVPGGVAAADTAPSSFANCPIDGNVSPNGPNTAALKALNVAKNRFAAPHNSDIDTTFTLANLLKPGADDGRFNATKAGELEGFVVNVLVGGVETVNCKATDALHRDTHIEVAETPNADSTKRVIVEVTPRWRAEMQALGVDWSTAGLKSLIGKRVRFRGWQLFDAEHRSQAKNTAPNNPKDWRATVWEIHPITSFKIISP
jgi:SH3-like domain-containing protein